MNSTKLKFPVIPENSGGNLPSPPLTIPTHRYSSPSQNFKLIFSKWLQLVFRCNFGKFSHPLQLSCNQNDNIVCRHNCLRLLSIVIRSLAQTRHPHYLVLSKFITKQYHQAGVKIAYSNIFNSFEPGE